MGEIIKPSSATNWTIVAASLINLPGNQLGPNDPGTYTYTQIGTNQYFFTHWFNLSQTTVGGVAINDKWQVEPFGSTVALSIDYAIFYASYSNNTVVSNQQLNWNVVNPLGIYSRIEYQINFDMSGLAFCNFGYNAIITTS